MRLRNTPLLCLLFFACDDGAEEALQGTPPDCSQYRCPVGFNSLQIADVEAVCSEAVNISASDGPLVLSLDVGERVACAGNGTCRLACEPSCPPDKEIHINGDSYFCVFPCVEPLQRDYRDGMPICVTKPEVLNPCAGEDCSGHGRCDSDNGQARCLCDPGYVAEGLDCVEDAPPPCDGQDCAGHGRCVEQGEAARCLCDPGYVAEGLDCVQERPGTVCEGPLRDASPCNGCPVGTIVPDGWACVPGGAFEMSTTLDGVQSSRRVTVGAFLMQLTEVTFSRFGECVADGACDAPHVNDGTCNVKNGAVPTGELPRSFQSADQPVVCVTWHQAKQYASWLSDALGLVVDLPSEAQWEYAATAGATSRYPWGENPVASCAAGTSVIPDADGTNGCGRDETWPVGSMREGTSLHGFLDLGGNVHEWIDDCYHSTYDGGPTSDRAWSEACDEPGKVVRDCAWNGGDCRAARWRYQSPANHADSDYGFRLIIRL